MPPLRILMFVCLTKLPAPEKRVREVCRMNSKVFDVWKVFRKVKFE